MGGPNSGHRGFLHWYDNQYSLPYRTQVQCQLMMYKQELQRCQIAGDFYSNTFDLDIPDQKREYEQIMDHILAKWYVQLHKERIMDPATGKVRVYLEWAQRYLDVPLKYTQPDVPVSPW